MNSSTVGETFCSSAYTYPNTRYPVRLSCAGRLCMRMTPGQRTYLQGVAWYHSHGDAETRIGTFAGLAGFYILRLPVGTPTPLDDLFPGVFDFPLALADRTFGKQPRAGGGDDVCLCYSVAPQTNDLAYGVWQPEWGGRVAVVNGKIWPVMRVSRSAYRFRLLNIASARTWALQIRAVSGNTPVPGGADAGSRSGGNSPTPSLDACQSAVPLFYQISSGNGLFVKSRDVVASGMLISPAERPEVVLGASARSREILAWLTSLRLLSVSGWLHLRAVQQ